ncbi:DUF1992 domain-containing protein [Rhodococcus sp. DMU2021]|uniref:DnaJ family domain-containing protein n=1 Tax=Rhodococcus sp. DMU2021 TaxID=2866997 RepID=UPI001C7D38AD|nr:DUF1992 domain-containing protein [Rhodococcus sp. DMU2021]MBX4168696.1 DUF1992 domain-containing protein [Rhodococcus sp. DMU2021]
MTERKRWDLTFETWIERQIRVAQDRGDFDDLPGYGKPIPDHGDDELWWVKSYLAREGLSTEALLPPELQLRREIERLPGTVGSAPSEKVVREIVSDLNRRIADCLRFPSGLPVPIHKVDAEEMVEVWTVERARRREEARAALNSTRPRLETESEAGAVRRGWIFRWFRRRNRPVVREE